jgi:predicted permease
VLTVLVFGLAPAIRGSRVSLQSALTGRAGDGGPAGIRTRQLLVALQVALSLVLLVGASVFVRTLRNLKSEDIGAADRQRLLLVWTLPGQTGRRNEDVRSLVARVHNRLASVPGVASVSESGSGLLSGSSGGPRVWVPGEISNGRAGIPVDGSMTASSGFFETVGQPVLAGRAFTQLDNDTSARVVIVNESLARRLFGFDSPLGRRVATSPDPRAQSYEIVGVVKDARYRNPREPAGLMTYWPLLSSGRAPRVTFVVRASGDPQTLATEIRREIRAAEPTLPVLGINTLEEQLDDLLFQERLTADFSAFFGVLALLLASIGLFGIVSYVAAQRTREIGIRIALGASRRGVLGMILGDSVRLVVAGTLAGAPLAILLTRQIESLAYGIPSRDIWAIAAAAILLLMVAVIAALMPAHRASKVDPALALRTAT